MKNTSLKPSSNLRTIDVINNNGEFLEKVSVNTVALDSFFTTPPGVIKIVLTEAAGAIGEQINYNGKTYLTNIIAGSGLKSDKPFLYAVENVKNDELLKLLNFKESIAYSQRALLPSAELSVGGQVRVTSFSADNPKRNFILKNGVSLSVYDGWGFIKKSAISSIDGKNPAGKRFPRIGAGSLNYQQLIWYDQYNSALIEELSTGSAPKIQELLSHPEPLTENGEILRQVHNLLSAGNIHTEMFVAMPSPDGKLTLPADQRFSTTGGKGIGIFRNPADKFNLLPIDKENLSYNEGKKSGFINEMEAIQYSLTGKLNGNQVLFKGMLGIIDDALFPDEFNDYDIINNAADRKLSSDWTTMQDRNTTQSQSLNSVVDGNLMVTQWYGAGNIGSIPEDYMKYLSGDFDGDEISVVFERENPELFKYIKNGYKENQQVSNPKIEKTFTPRGSFSGMEHIMAYRSQLIGTASNTAGAIASMPKSKLDSLVKMLQRLEPDAQDRPSSSDQLIENLKHEVRLLIKEGTDIFKTQKSPTKFENRLKIINEIISRQAHIPKHTKMKRLMFNNQDIVTRTGQHYTLSRLPKLSEGFWSDLYFSYNEKDILQQYIIEGLPARVFGKVLDDLLSPEDRQNLNAYRENWKNVDGAKNYIRYANYEIQKLIEFAKTQDVTINNISSMVSLSEIDGISVKVAPQALLVGDNSIGICDSLSDAWLFTLSNEDNGKMKSALLDSIYTRSRILANENFEQGIGTDINLPEDIDRFINTLQEVSEPVARKTMSLREITHQLFVSEDVSLSLHTGNHAIGVARKSGKIYFYDPNLVEISFGVSSVPTENQLYKLFSDYFNISISNMTLDTYYDLQTMEGELMFEVAGFDHLAKGSKPAFINLTKYLSNPFNTLSGNSYNSDFLRSVQSQESWDISVKMVDSSRQATKAVADDMNIVSERIVQSITAAGYSVNDILEDIPLRINESSHAFVSVKKNNEKIREIDVDLSDIKFSSKQLVNDSASKLTRLNSVLEPANEVLGKGIGALTTLRSLDEIFTGLRHHNSQAVLEGSGWLTYNILNLTGVDQKIFNKLAQKAGDIFFKDSEVAIEDFSSLFTRSTRALLVKAGIESERVLSVAGEIMGRLPVIALAFGAYSVYEDVKTLQEDEDNGMPQWKTDLDKADIGLDVFTTLLQTAAPFTGPFAPILEGAALLVMGIRMSIDSIVTEFNTGHEDLAWREIALDVFLPISMLIKPFIKIFGGDKIIQAVNDIDNLFNLQTDSKREGFSILDLSKGSKMSDDDIMLNGNPAHFAGDITVDFSKVTSSGGEISIEGQHSPGSGAFGSDNLKFSGKKNITTDISTVVLGLGANYDQKGELSANVSFSAMERIIGNNSGNTFYGPQSGGIVKNANGDQYLYRYIIHAGNGENYLYLGEGNYEFDGGNGHNTIIGKSVNLDSTDQMLVWNLLAQHKIALTPSYSEPHLFLTAINNTAASSFIKGDLDMNTILLQKVKVEAYQVQNVVGSYQANVNVFEFESSAANKLGEFRTKGALREVFISDENNVISTGGGDDIIYRGKGNCKYIINRSYALISRNGGKYPGFVKSEQDRLSLLALKTEKTFIYTEVNIITPEGKKPKNDYVYLEGSHFDNIVIKEDTNGIFLGYGDNLTGLYVRANRWSDMNDLYFVTDDGVILKIEKKNENYISSIESIDVNKLYKNNNGRLDLTSQLDKATIIVRKGTHLELPDTWNLSKNIIFIDEDYSHLRMGGTNTNSLFIDNMKGTGFIASNMKDGDFRIYIPNSAGQINIRTKDGYQLSMKQSGGAWTQESEVVNLAEAPNGKVLSSELYKGILTQGKGALDPSVLTQNLWKSRNPLKTTVSNKNIWLYTDTNDGWIEGTSQDDMLESSKGTSLLDGGLGNDTYMIRRNSGVVILADSGIHSLNDNWANERDNKAGLVMFSDVLFSEIKSEIFAVTVNEITYSVLTLYVVNNVGKEQLIVKVLVNDIAGYQFISKDGISFIYMVDENGDIVQKISGFNMTWWEKHHASNTDAELLTTLLSRLEGRYEGSATKRVLTLNRPAAVVVPEDGTTELHLRSGTGIIELHKKEGNKQLYLDASETSVADLKVSVANMTAITSKAELWNNIVASTSSELEAKSNSKSPDETKIISSSVGSLVKGKLIKVKGKIWLEANTSYLVQNRSKNLLMNFTMINANNNSNFLITQNGGEANSGLYLYATKTGFYDFAFLAYSLENSASYNLKISRESDGQSKEQPIKFLNVKSGGSASNTDKTTVTMLHYPEFIQEELNSFLSIDKQKLSISAGKGVNKVSVTIPLQDYLKYQILTNDGILTSISTNGELYINQVDFKLREDDTFLDMNQYTKGKTSMSQLSWLTVKGDERKNAFIAGKLSPIMWYGSPGDDVIKGSQKGDIIQGGAGKDILLGDLGDDTIIGGNDLDVIDGGGGNDTVFYTGNTKTATGVTINLDKGYGMGADAEGDSLINIENVVGSEFDDVLIGNKENNILFGADGSDILISNGGGDILRGGKSSDYYLIKNSDAVVTISNKSTLQEDALHYDTYIDFVILDVSTPITKQKLDNHLILISVNTHIILEDWFVSDSAKKYLFIFPGTTKENTFLIEGRMLETWIENGQGAYYDVPRGLFNKVRSVLDLYNQNAPLKPTSRILTGDSVSFQDLNKGVDVNLNIENTSEFVITSNGDVLSDTVKNVRGTNSDDVIQGDERGNIIEGGGGADTLSGGDGFDILSYENSVEYWDPKLGKNMGVHVDLQSNLTEHGDAGTTHQDNVTGFEGVKGSKYADQLSGSDADNMFIPNGFENNGFNNQRDIIDGKEGSDWVSFESDFYNRGVKVDLTNENAQWRDGSDNIANLKNLENIIGSDGNDLLTGSGEDNSILGGKGNDTLKGNGGSDLLIGGKGSDVYEIYKGDRLEISQKDNDSDFDELKFKNLKKNDLSFFYQEDDLLIADELNTFILLKNWKNGDNKYVVQTNEPDGFYTMNKENFINHVQSKVSSISGDVRLRQMKGNNSQVTTPIETFITLFPTVPQIVFDAAPVDGNGWQLQAMDNDHLPASGHAIVLVNRGSSSSSNGVNTTDPNKMIIQGSPNIYFGLPTLEKGTQYILKVYGAVEKKGGSTLYNIWPQNADSSWRIDNLQINEREIIFCQLKFTTLNDVEISNNRKYCFVIENTASKIFVYKITIEKYFLS
ncbi:hypothetical protein [Chryseobacterium sp. OSA05B]|uniref:hypothetical protein n=1 Tax=Chryseobacterium sp. OSA05B TaxID=2862650 RepID=UPI001CBA71B4|nr:hypothetical protein [Chryseobacterium sp. OSA05B]